MKPSIVWSAVLMLALSLRAAEAAPPRSQAAKSQRPAAAQTSAPNRNMQLIQLRGQASMLVRRHATNKAREARLGDRLQRARTVENGARRNYETQVSTHGERSPQARAARKTLDSSRATRANIELNLDSARSQTRTTRRQNTDARRALSRARRGDWAGAQRADARVNRAPLPRARKITFAKTVQVRTVSMAPDVVNARKGQLKPKRR